MFLKVFWNGDLTLVLNFWCADPNRVTALTVLMTDTVIEHGPVEGSGGLSSPPPPAASGDPHRHPHGDIDGHAAPHAHRELPLLRAAVPREPGRRSLAQSGAAPPHIPCLFREPCCISG